MRKIYDVPLQTSLTWYDPKTQFGVASAQLINAVFELDTAWIQVFKWDNFSADRAAPPPPT